MDDQTLWNRFNDGALSHSEWTHTAHLRVAWLFLRRYPLDEAHFRIRIGIIKLNAAHGVVESVSRGYHDTLTRAWLILVGHWAASDPQTGDSAQFLERHVTELARDALTRHYSRERLFSIEARARFVEPDRMPLPEVRSGKQ